MHGSDGHKFKCLRCPFATSLEEELLNHVKVVHDPEIAVLIMDEIKLNMGMHWLFSIATQIVINIYSNFAIAKVVDLNLLASFIVLASFLNCFSYCRCDNLCDSNCCRSFALLKTIAKSIRNIFAIASKSENYRYCDSCKSDNFRESSQEMKQIRTPQWIWRCIDFSLLLPK